MMFVLSVYLNGRCVFVAGPKLLFLTFFRLGIDGSSLGDIRWYNLKDRVNGRHSYSRKFPKKLLN